MAEPQHGWTDEHVEQIVGNLLRAGVVLAALVVACGAVIYLIRHGYEPADFYEKKVDEANEPHSPTTIVEGVLNGRGRALIQLGVLLLIATPVARVIFSAFAFGFQRDRLYVGITLIVLAVLLFSLFFGHLFFTQL